MLVRLKPTATQPHSPLQLVTGYEPNVSHLCLFGRAIYVGYDSPSIISYLEPLTGDLFTVHFSDCHFDETVCPN